ncbi:MAG: hypothetical protein JO128_03335 [Alphaproteobacteria bacterium]|nr:hypothetical protein [Alphaproteobacteria bacterium]
MFATFHPTLASDASRPSVRNHLRSLAKPALAIGGALVAMAALMGLRFGLYAATHRDLPVVLHLFEHIR